MFDPNKYGRLIPMLEDWAKWMRSYNPARGFSDHAVMLNSLASKDLEEMEGEILSTVCHAVDSAVDDLPPAENAAVNYQYGLCRIVRFPRNNLDELLEIAHDKLFVTIKKKGVEII